MGFKAVPFPGHFKKRKIVSAKKSSKLYLCDKCPHLACKSCIDEQTSAVAFPLKPGHILLQALRPKIEPVSTSS